MKEKLKVKPTKKIDHGYDENYRPQITREYSPAEDLDMIGTNLVVFEDYEYSRKDNEILAKGKWQLYNPFDYAILEELIKINYHNLNECINFYKKYGLLGQFANPAVEQTVGSTSPTWLSRRESVGYFMDSIIKLRKCVSLFNALDKDRQYKFDDEDNLTLEHLPGFGKNSDMPDKISFLLTKYMNSGLSGVSPIIQIGQDGRLFPGFQSRNLLSVAYYQLSKIITGENVLKTCAYCGSWFIPTGNKQRFCPREQTPRFKDTRSSCENRYNQMLHRARNAIEKGDSIEKWANIMGISVAQMEELYAAWKEKR